MSRSLRALLTVLLLLLAVPITGFGPPTLVESNASDTAVSPRVAGLIKQDRAPRVQASAAVLVDAETGSVVFEKNAHARRAPASTTKIMTALVTLRNARLDDVVVAGSEVEGIEPTIIGLDPGDRLTVEQLLYGLLLPSGNDAAVALAKRVGGSIPRFVSMMNEEAADLGLDDTQFVNPNGLDADGHYSSAFDLALIARAALKDPTFARVVSTREYSIPGPPRWLFRSTNILLGTFPGADGVKTGYTDNAGRCLVLSATRDGRRAIAVVLDSEATWADSSALLDYFFANYSSSTLTVAGSPLATYFVGDEARSLVAMARPQVVLPRWQEPYLRLFFDVVVAPDGQGASGSVDYYLFGRKKGQIELIDAGG